MSRRRRAVRRPMPSDAKYGSPLVTRLVNVVMRDGKKTIAEKVVYGAFDRLAERVPATNPMDVLQRAVDNAKPRLEVKARRVGGATYQVPMEVTPDRQNALALRWLVKFASSKRGVALEKALANEIMDAFQGQGSSIQRRDEVHRMAQSNKAFAHFRW